MGAWRKSAWYGSSWYDSAWYGGTGGGGASTATGGGTVASLALPAGWREITAKELRANADRVHARERDKRLARFRGVKPMSQPSAPVAPARPASSPEVDALARAVVRRGDPVDALARLLDKRESERDAETQALARDGRLVVVGKSALSRRAVVLDFGARRATVVKFDPNQPRDEAGRFGEGGGAAGSVGGSKPVNHKAAAKAFAKANAQTFKGGSAAEVKAAQAKFLSAQGFDDKEIAAFAQHEKQWYSSVYTEGGQVMRQVAAKEMGRDFKADDFHDSKPILDRAPTDRERGMVNAVRAFTTEGLREKYGDSVTVYRGVADAQADALMGGEGSTVDMGLNSLSSWSLEKDTAENYALFGKTKSGALVSVKVPVENVWLADFKEGRNEVVIGAKSQRVRVPRSAVSPRMRKATGVGEFSYPTDGGAMVVLDNDPESANWLNAVDAATVNG